MKTLLRTIIILAILAGIMFITVPTPERHREMVKEKFIERFEKENPNALETLGAKLLINIAFTNLDIDDYVVLNIGYINHATQGTQYISIGMFNHVFLIDNLDL